MKALLFTAILFSSLTHAGVTSITGTFHSDGDVLHNEHDMFFASFDVQEQNRAPASSGLEIQSQKEPELLVTDLTGTFQ